MKFEKQIAAFLQGDLTDEETIAELLHVLSVSPEKRTLLREQLVLSRELNGLLGSVTPAPETDHGLFERIAAFEGGPSAPPLVASPGATVNSTPEVERRFRVPALVALLLLVAGLAGGYLIGTIGDGTGDTDAAGPMAAATSSTSSVNQEGSRAVTDVNGNRTGSTTTRAGSGPEGAQTRDLAATAERDRLTSELAAAKDALRRERNVNVDLRAEVARAKGAVSSDQTVTFAQQSDAVDRQVQIRHVESSEVLSIDSSLIATGIEEADELLLSSAPLAVTYEEPKVRGLQPWRVDMRQHFGTSLPRVQGLDTDAGLMSNREFALSLRIGGESWLPAPVRIAAAGGVMSFTQVLHTNEGNPSMDTIIEQRPNLTYARAMIAPELITSERFVSSIELGAGGTQLGPIASFGVAVEYRPIASVAVNAGLSSWLLWSSWLGQIHTSTNLNAHIGFGIHL